MPISTVIFDLDGLLADTERLHMESYKTVLGRLGHELSDEVYIEHWIRIGKGIRQYLEENSLDLDLEEIRELKKNEYNRLVAEEAQPMPGAIELLEELHGSKTLVLATSSYGHSADAVMTALRIERFFNLVAAKESSARVKPAPDIFIHVSDTLEVSPLDCVVLEDSEKGVIAAISAGMKCIAVPNKYTRNSDLSSATLVLDSLSCVNTDLIDNL
jgi:HAD superfamily hydrolase (TIGR01509 family)